MSSFVGPVDLDNCADEPIHLPGSIQPHGLLLAFDEASPTVTAASENLQQWLELDAPAAIGRPLAAVIGPDAAADVAEALTQSWTHRYDELPLATRTGAVVATLHRTGGRVVLEAERPGDTGLARLLNITRDAAMQLQGAATVVDVAARAVEAMRSLTGFDRVMVYRFDREWNGEVIAEARTPTLNSFLGLHYPATDIPAQARELYRRNWLRLIPDIAYRPVPIHPRSSFADDQPLDLSLATLRSVSPIHVEYLSNMGVSASMSVSILVDGNLWGLIACHHYSGPHRPSVAQRNAAEHLGQLISLRVAETAEADTRRRVMELTALADGAADAFVSLSLHSVEEALQAAETDILKLAGASAAVVLLGGRSVTLGRMPDVPLGELLAPHWNDDGTFVTEWALDEVVALGPEWPAATGVLAVSLSSDRRDLIAWLRPELVRTVDWGGDPANAKIAADEGDGVRLSPRKSFERWRETVRRRSAPWEEAEVRAAKRFARHLGSALVRREREARALVEDLQRTMLPEALPDLAPSLLDAYYAPADVVRVGGDWYDVVPLDHRHMVLVIGDVAGHGLEAAAEMAQLRNGLRAYLIGEPSLGDALARLNRMVQILLPGALATLACARIDLDTGTVTFARAGHLPPLLVDDADTALLPLTAGRIIGVGDAPHEELAVPLRAGTTIVLYSDGLVERQDRSLETSMSLLVAEASDVFGGGARPGTSGELARRMRSGSSNDDVTVLAFTWRPGHDSTGGRR